MLNCSQMLWSGQGGLTPPPPYGQPDQKTSGFFLTTSLRKDVEVSNLFALKSAGSLVLMRGRMAFPVCLLLQRQALKRDKNFAETEPL